jgi:hypothetical protein
VGIEPTTTSLQVKRSTAELTRLVAAVVSCFCTPSCGTICNSSVVYFCGCCSASSRIRTYDQRIRSPMLYPLSYRGYVLYRVQELNLFKKLIRFPPSNRSDHPAGYNQLLNGSNFLGRSRNRCPVRTAQRTMTNGLEYLRRDNL